MKNIIKKKSKGFTLIELIVVIAIIGILGVVAIPRFTNMTKAASKAALISQHDTIKGAILMYMAENSGKKPTSIADLKDQIVGVTNASDLNDKPQGAEYSIGDADTYDLPNSTSVTTAGPTLYSVLKDTDGSILEARAEEF